VVRDLQGRFAEAQEAYRHALVAAPDSTDVQMNLGMSLALAAQGTQTVRGAVATSPAAPILPIAPVPADSAHIVATPSSANLRAEPAPIPQRQSEAKPGISKRAATDDAYLARTPAPSPAPRMPVFASEVASRVTASAALMPGEMGRIVTDLSRMAPAEPAQPGPRIAARQLGTNEPYAQLASLVSEPGATLEWQRLSKRLPDLLKRREPTITTAEVRGRTYWRLRTFGFPSIAEASELCDRVKAAGLGCWSGRGL
jgi:hypothetical protein